MFSVALIGVDGAGKTTIARRLEQTLPFPVKYLYMGLNVASSNVMLPTSWLVVNIKRALGNGPEVGGPAEPTHSKQSSEGSLRHFAKSLRSSLSLTNLLAEECFRYFIAWIYQRYGYLVLFDRWFYADYYASNNTNWSYGSWIHEYMLQRVFPKPDIVIFLDVPAEVSFARKGEDTLASLELRRRKYLSLQDSTNNFNVVDATRSEEIVLREVATLLNNFFTFRFCDEPQMKKHLTEARETIDHENFDRQLDQYGSD
jgi:thymidylate kinase